MGLVKDQMVAIAPFFVELRRTVGLQDMSLQDVGGVGTRPPARRQRVVTSTGTSETMFG